MKDKIADAAGKLLIIVGLSVLLVLFGVWLRSKLIGKEVSVTYRWIETTGSIEPDTLKQKRKTEPVLVDIDSLRERIDFFKGSAERLDSVLADLLIPRFTVFDDTVKIEREDMMMSFIEHHRIEYTPMEKSVLKTTIYDSLKIRFKSTIETAVVEPTFWDYVLDPVFSVMLLLILIAGMML